MRHTVKKISLWVALFALVLLGACTKTLDAPLPVAAKGVRDTAASIRNVLRSSSCTLFYQAFIRASLDSPYAFYTVFAPSDSAMTAAGLTSSVISSLSLDSLYKLIGYHIIPGRYGDVALENDTLTLQLPTLRIDAGQTLDMWGGVIALNTQQFLYLSKHDTLYVNGEPSNKGEPAMEASNGWIYPVNHLLQAPEQTVWDIIKSRPELSMYVEANRLVDSMYQAQYFYYGTIDSIIFSTITYLPTYSYSTPSTQEMVSVLAPTNDAFAKAGFNTVADLQSYVNQTLPGSNNISLPSYPYYVTLSQYSAMDSVLKLHYFYNPGQSIVFYQDMLYSPNINDGWLNTNQFYQQAYNSFMTAYPNSASVYSHFSNNGDILQVKWNPNVPAVSIPFSNANSFMGINGVVYEIDQLFYPHN